MSSHATAVADALANEDDVAFCYALVALAPEYDATPFRERPQGLGLLGGLATLYLTVDHRGDIAGFLEDGAGEGFDEALEWCREIGALAAAAYLEDVARLFLDGRVPRDEQKRCRVSFRLQRRRSGDALAAADERHATAMPELLEALRRYIAANLQELEALVAAARPSPEPTELERLKDQVAHLENALPQLEAMGNRTRDRCGSLQLLAEARGLRAFDATRAAEYEAFIGGLSHLSVDDWIVVARRLDAARGKALAAKTVAHNLSVDLMVGRLIPLEQYKSHFKPMVNDPIMAARDQLLTALESRLPERVGGEDEPLELWRTVRELLIGTSFVLLTYDWLMPTREGRRSVAVCEAIWRGYAELPSR